ncbi:MAG TPA: caspase family protein [Longimicrobiales bacterium]|nr:caspase family protein [Longimicrobiales bacterium]
MRAVRTQWARRSRRRPRAVAAFVCLFAVPVSAMLFGPAVAGAQAGGAGGSAGQALPDLRILKSGPVSAFTQDVIVYEITFWNASRTNAQQVVVRDILPPGVTFVDASDGGVEAGGVVTWPVRPALSDDRPHTYTVSVTAPCPATLHNTASIESASADANPADNTAVASTVVTGTACEPAADVGIRMTGPASAIPGDTLAYSLLVWNDGPATAVDVVVSDTLPAAGTFVGASGGATWTGGVLTWPALSLSPGDTALFEILFEAPACARITNFASVSSDAVVDPDPSNNQAAITTIVDSAGCADADVVIDKQADVLLVARGDTVEFRLKVWNDGPLTALDVAVTDSLPRDHGFVSATGGPVLSGDVLVWPRIPRLTVGDTITHTITVTIPATYVPENYTNVGRAAAARPADPDPTNNRDEVTVGLTRVGGLGPDLAVTKEVVDGVLGGPIVRYRITITNHGEGPTTGPIELVDSLPAGVTFEAANGLGWVVTESGGVVTASYAAILQAGESTTLGIAVRLADSTVGEVCNAVRVATAGEVELADNRAEACSTVPAKDAIDLEKVADRQDVVIGGGVEYRLTLVATGSVPLEEVRVIDVLPPAFTFEDGSARVDGLAIADPARGSSGTLAFQLGTLVPPDTVIVTYIARAGPGSRPGQALNRARAFYRGGTSNEAVAAVRVRQGAFTDEGMIVGTVFADSSGAVRAGGQGDCLCLPSDLAQRDERGIPGVLVVLQDGTSALTDAEGRYLFAALSPRTWVVKVDRSTLPPGTGLISLTNRHADDGGTVLVDLKRGELHRADFAVGWAGPGLAEHIERQRAFLDSAVADPALSAAGLRSPGGPTGLATGIPWTRYSPVMPDAWSGRLFPDRGPLSDLAGFPRAVADATDAGGSGRRMAAAVSPDMADSASTPGQLAIGLVEARLDFRSTPDSELVGIGRDAFEDALLSVSFDDDDGRVHGGTRAALLYRGRAADRFDVLVRLDSEEDERAGLFRDITPDDFYPIRGDGSVSGFGARSRGRVYARIGTGDSYLTWGDFNTGRAPVALAGTRSLGEYARTMNGALQHWESDRFAVDAFASRDRSVQVVDVIRAEGVSGPYGLSRLDGMENSERVELITRDRDQPAVVLRTEVLERFTDYSIEPLAGRILFRRPVPAFDEDLNPVEIRVTYEVEGDTDRFWVWGANARLQPVSGIEIGGSIVRDENPVSPLDLGSVHGTIALPASTWLTGEYARTGGGSLADGDAARFELRHESDRVRLRGFLVTTDSAFRNPSSGYMRGREELGLLGLARLAAGTTAFTELLASEDVGTETRRRGARIGIRQALSAWLSGQFGFRWASTSVDAAASPVQDDTKAVGIRLQASLAGDSADRRGSAFIEFEQDVQEADRRRAAVGADLRVLSGVRLYARHEFINSLTGPWHLDRDLERNATVFGVATENRAGQAMFSEYRVRDAIDGREAQAAIGLRNAWRVSEGLRLSASLERLTPIGSGSTDATAVTGGAEYTGSPTWKGSVRTEYQARDGADNLFGSAGYARRLSPAFSLLGNAVFSTRLDGDRAWSRSRLGIAYRQVDANQWNGLARYEHRYDRSSGAEPVAGRSYTATHILAGHLDFQPIAGTTLRGQWTSRFTSERHAGVRTAGSAHLAGGRGTVDLGSRLDVGLIGRSLFMEGRATARFGFGGEIGVRLPADLRLAAGYNVFGFRDEVVTSEQYTDHGAYVQLAFRFDEGLWSGRDVPGGRQDDGECRCPPPSGRGPYDPPSADPRPDLDVVIIAPTRVLSGEGFVVEIVTRNAPAPAGPADSVAVTARLPRAARFVSTPETDLRFADPRLWAMPPAGGLEPGADRSHWMLVLADSVVGTTPDSIILGAAVGVRPNEMDSTNNHASTVVRILPRREPDPCVDAASSACAPDLFVWITGPHKVGSRDSIRYEFWTRNIGNAPAIDVVSRVWFPGLPDGSQDSDEAAVRRDTTFVISGRLEPNIAASWGVTLPPTGRPAMLVAETRSETVTPETDLTNNDDRKVTLVPCDSTVCIGLRIDGPAVASMGDTVRYTIFTDNPGATALNDVLVSGSTDQVVGVAGAAVRSDDIGWRIPRISPAASHAATVDLVCSADRFNLGFVASTDSARMTAGHGTDCLLSDLVIRVESDDTTIRRPGDPVRYRIVTTNLGPGAARQVLIRASVPAGATWDSANTTGGPDVTRGPVTEVTWPVAATVAAGDSLEVLLGVVSRANELAVRVDAATRTSTPESDPDNNTAFVEVPLVPAVVPPIVPPPLPPPVPPDDREVDPVRRDPAGLVVDIAPLEVRRHTVHYTITTTNTADVTASDVRVEATWPGDVAFLYANRGAMTVGDSLILPPLDSLAPGRAIVDTLVVLMPPAPDSAVIEAFATAFATGTVSEVGNASTAANNRDTTVALMVIQEVIIPDTVFVTDTVFVVVGNRLVRWLIFVLPWLLILILIGWILWRRRQPDPEPTGPTGPTPVPGLPDLHAACGPIEVDGVRGTAYLVRLDRLVTCSHVVLNRQRGDLVTIRLNDRIVSATVHAVDAHIGIAILRPAELIRDVRPLELATDVSAPSWWRGYGFPGGTASPGVEFGGAILQTSARDRFGFPIMTLTGPGLARLFQDPANGLAGSPVLVDGRVVGHLRGHMTHSDTLTRSFADLVKAAPVSRIIEMLRDDEPEGGQDRRSTPSEPAEPKGWSIAPELDASERGAHHATLVYRTADDAFARKLAARLEGFGFEVRLRQRESSPVPGAAGEGAGQVFLLHSRAWNAAADADRAGPLVEGGLDPVIVRVDDSPLPDALKRFVSIDFCGHGPDRGLPFRALLKMLAGESASPDGISVIDVLTDTTEAVIDVVRSARGKPKRTRFAIKRWRESGIPGHAPDLLAARQLLEGGLAEDAIEILEHVPAGLESSRLAAMSLAAAGRIDDAIAKLESLRSAGHADSGTVGLLAELNWKKWIEGGRRRVAGVRKAFELSSALYGRTRDPRDGMETARYALASGDADQASLMASEVRDAMAGQTDFDGRDWGVLGQANLLLGDDDTGFDALERAVAAEPDDVQAIGALYRRVIDIVDGMKADAKRLGQIRARLESIFYLPRVATIVTQNGDASAVSAQALRAELRARIEEHDVGFAVCCPDTLPALLLAEEVLRRGGRVNARLPLPREEFTALRISAVGASLVEAVLSHERTTIVVVHARDHLGRRQPLALTDGSVRAADEEAVREMVLDAATRLAEERCQRPIVYQGGADDASGPPDFLLEPRERGPERVTLAALGGVATEPGDATRPATAVAVGRTRDIKGIRREAPDVPTTFEYRRLFCVVIGIDEYTQWNPLLNAVNDATGLGKVLETGFGFTVRSLINAEATRDRIREIVLDTVAAEVEKDDLLVLFFAGHGHTERMADDEERGFLVPVDARADHIGDLLPMEEVVTWPDQLACEDVLCIFDSCFSGFAAFAGGVTRRGESDDARIAISAGSAEQPVLDGGAPGGFEDHSIFTAHLLLRLNAALEAAAAGGEEVDSMRLYVDLRDKVATATARRQTPVYGFLSGHGAGEIWLKVRKPRDV